MCCDNCCTHMSTDEKWAKREAEAAREAWWELRDALIDHQRGVLDDEDLYALIRHTMTWAYA